jgi:hypothetical protein
MSAGGPKVGVSRGILAAVALDSRPRRWRCPEAPRYKRPGLAPLHAIELQRAIAKSVTDWPYATSDTALDASSAVQDEVHNVARTPPRSSSPATASAAPKRSPDLRDHYQHPQTGFHVPMEATVDPPFWGSPLEADHPRNGVLIPCRFTSSRGPSARRSRSGRAVSASTRPACRRFDGVLLGPCHPRSGALRSPWRRIICPPIASQAFRPQQCIDPRQTAGRRAATGLLLAIE